MTDPTDNTDGADGEGATDGDIDSETGDVDEELQRIRERKRQELLDQTTGTGAEGTKANENRPGADATPPDTPIEIESRDHLEQVATAHELVLLDCYADWCGPCKMMEPVIEELAATTEAAVAKLDVDRNQQLAAQLGARSIPTFVVFGDGEPVERFVGAQDRSTLERGIARAAG